MNTPRANQLIARLPRVDQQRFFAASKRVELVSGEVLNEPGESIRHVYFPIESDISLMSPLDNHASLEVALIGNEGMLGIALAQGVDVSALHASVQNGGSSWRINAAPFRRELRKSPELRRCLNFYIHVRSHQLAQLAACNRFHLIEARLARRLLMSQDRSDSNELHLTQELIASMLGVRRVGITKAASVLQKRRLISYNRGIITILNRRGLEAAACGCYRADKASYVRILCDDSSDFRCQR
jgi:CRP-like cAMP-binding protein